MYATAKPAGILWGLAIDQKTNGMQNGQAVVALMAITGNIDRPGGQVVGDINSGSMKVDLALMRALVPSWPRR